MSLTERTGGSSSPESVALGEALAFFGAVADFAAGAPPESGERVASLAVALARQAGLSTGECDALYYAARLRNAGALGNAGLAKGGQQSSRSAAIARWDIPADGARLCARIAALPQRTADVVRWQSECWDGTGFPDQLRWSGIPPAAQLLHIAAAAVSTSDIEDAFSAINAESGRTFAPESVRAFTMWFHLSGGEIEPVRAPIESLFTAETRVEDVISILSECIDRHNGTPGRGKLAAKHAVAAAAAAGLSAGEQRDLERAALLFAAGELRESHGETERFGPLARLGIKTRARNAATAADLIAHVPAFDAVAAVVRARGEWYDGTGAPRSLRHEEIPMGARVLAVAAAFADGAPLDHIEKAAGTQFDPHAVRAFAKTVQVRA